MRIERWEPKRDGPLSEHALRRKLRKLGYLATRYHYPPGTIFDEHAHDVDEIDAILSGRFRMEMEGRSIELGAGDTLYVPRGTMHRAAVVGDEPVVSLDAVRRE